MISMKQIMLISTLVAITGCAEQTSEDDRLSMALAKGDESLLAESLLCAGASNVLQDYSTNTYPELMQWSESFDKIAGNAMQTANKMKGQDGAAIESRLKQIKMQTEQALEQYASNDNRGKLSEFVEQTIQQCTRFATPA